MVALPWCHNYVHAFDTEGVSDQITCNSSVILGYMIDGLYVI